MIKKKLNIVKWGLALSVIVLSACSKKEELNSSSNLTVSNMSELVAPLDFSWSASLKGGVSVNFDNPTNMSVENEMAYLIDADGNVLKKDVIQNKSIHFNVALPEDSQYFVYFPNTGEKTAVTKSGSMNMIIDGTSISGKKKSKTNSASCTVCSSPFENGGGEDYVFSSNQTITNANNVPGWETTASDNKIEIWKSAFSSSVNAQEGNQFFELNANVPSALYQSLCLEPGSTIKWSVYHRGRSGVDVAQVRIGSSIATATTEATMTDGTSAWGYYSGTYVIPAGQTTTLFIFEAVSAAGGKSVGNFIDNFEISCDKDGDGVVDIDDDYPDDPTRAYTSYYPTAGKQVIAFEDLWPSLGDFDFNDMVLSNQVVVSKNSNNEIVDASFKISIDAIGAGLHNGIAMMLYNGSNQIIGNNIISSISGDAALDPNNTNGIILSDDVFATISSYYQNNGAGPSATPDTLSFTINFASGNAIDITPELYLFRSNDRSHEVHLSGNPRTSSLNQNLLGTEDDNGDFKTAEGLPWGIEIITSNTFQNPLEKIDIVEAYPQFQQWATSGGGDNESWYNSPDSEKIFAP